MLITLIEKHGYRVHKGIMKNTIHEKMECVCNLISFVCRASCVNNSRLPFRDIVSDRNPSRPGCENMLSIILLQIF